MLSNCNVVVISKSGPKLLNAPNFTILIKNTIQFPTLDKHFRKYARILCFHVLPFNSAFSNRRNIHDSASLNLSTCRFDFDTDLFCPIFPVKKIIAMLERNFTFEELATNVSLLLFMCMANNCSPFISGFNTWFAN